MAAVVRRQYVAKNTLPNIVPINEALPRQPKSVLLRIHFPIYSSMLTIELNVCEEFTKKQNYVTTNEAEQALKSVTCIKRKPHYSAEEWFRVCFKRFFPAIFSVKQTCFINGHLY